MARGRLHTALVSIATNVWLWGAVVVLVVQWLSEGETSFFGHDLHQQKLNIALSLDLAAPFHDGGLHLITSVFAHQSWSHALTNLAAFLMAALFFPPLDSRHPRISQWMGLTLLTLATNGLLVLGSGFAGLQEGRVLGLSSVVVAMASLALLTNPRRSWWLMGPILLSTLVWPAGATRVTYGGHLSGFCVGVLGAWCCRRWFRLGPRRKWRRRGRESDRRMKQA